MRGVYHESGASRSLFPLHLEKRLLQQILLSLKFTMKYLYTFLGVE